MTKISHLVQNHQIIKAPGFEELKPELSIFLPTYKRGDNGLFERTIKSILEQSFTNFELIIVDDASIDSTASIIKRYMVLDARIAVIRHKDNIGLAAVSEIEAMLLSRGQKTLCAFDDNIFTPNGIKALMDDQKNNPEHLISHGWMKLYIDNNEYWEFGRKQVDLSSLVTRNQIGHSSVLVDRKVFDDVGFYDPHFAVIRCWDWDLWLRIAQKYAFHFVGEEIVSEFGITQADSLGNTVGSDLVAVNIWSQKNRNESLRPKNILEYEFDYFPAYTGNYFRQSVSDIIHARFNNRFVLKQECFYGDGYILVVTDNYYERVGQENNCLFLISDDIFEADFYKYILGAKAVVYHNKTPSSLILNKLRTLKMPCYFVGEANDTLQAEDLNILEITAQNVSDFFSETAMQVFTNLFEHSHCPKLQLILAGENFCNQSPPQPPLPVTEIKYNFSNLLRVIKCTFKHYKNKHSRCR